MVQLLRRLNPSGIHVWEHFLAMLWRLSDQFSCIYTASRWTGPTWQDISIAGQIPTRESPWSHGWVCPKVMDSEIQLWFLTGRNHFQQIVWWHTVPFEKGPCSSTKKKDCRRSSWRFLEHPMFRSLDSNVGNQKKRLVWRGMFAQNMWICVKQMRKLIDFMITHLAKL